MEESMRIEEGLIVEESIELSVRGEKNQMEESMRVQEKGSLGEKYGGFKYIELQKETERWNQTSIYRVPAHIKNVKDSRAYQPQLVSLGPFHHDGIDLWPMEWHKHRALLHLVKRAKKPMFMFVDAVKAAADQLEAAYGQYLDQKWRGDNNRERFVEMMVTDGCFLLEAMRMIEEKGEVQEDYAPNDPVFSKHGYLYLKNVILADMFVMENQLPMLLLETLARHVPSERFQDVRRMITNMVVAFFGLPSDNSYLLDARLHPYVSSLHPIDIARKILCGEKVRLTDELRQRILRGESKRNADELIDIIHVLHGEDECNADRIYAFELRQRILRGKSSEGYADKWRERKDTMPSALELYEAGIHFKASYSRSLLDIDFQRGVLSMPVLRVHSYVGTVFLNLMAFEQLHPGAGNGVTEYLIFMDHIIDSAKDVKLLRSKGVMDCALGSDMEVAELFNTLSKGAVMDPSINLQDVRLSVNAYCRKPWNKWRASFLHTYFRNPWVFISLVAAAVLLVATLLQTIFAIKPLR